MKNIDDVKLDLKEKIIIAARDGNNNQILLDLIKGRFDHIFQDESKKLILDAIKTSSFQGQTEALTILLDKGKADISEIPSHDMCFNEIQTLLSDLTDHPEKYEDLYQEHNCSLTGFNTMFYIESI